MPEWRKLHTKKLASFDLNDMPDDFTRLMWVLLPLKLDKEGRGIDLPSWLRSNIFPLREDVTGEMLNTAMDWYEKHGLLERYEVAGRPYFWVQSFRSEQTTSKEAGSVLPSPPSPPEQVGSESGVGLEQVGSESGVGLEQVGSKSGSDLDVDQDVDQEKMIMIPPSLKNNGRGSLTEPIPISQWQSNLADARDKSTGLLEIIEFLFPYLAPQFPTPQDLTEITQTVGGTDRMITLLVRANEYQPQALLSYLLKMHQNDETTEQKKPPSRPSTNKGKPPAEDVDAETQERQRAALAEMRRKQHEHE